jgi:hypothetical protein
MVWHSRCSRKFNRNHLVSLNHSVDGFALEVVSAQTMGSLVHSR